MHSPGFEPDSFPASRVALSLAAGVARELELISRAALPAEACGCLQGSRVGAGWRVYRASLGRNLAAPASHRFELDPADAVRAEDAARESGLELIGFWHSHPGGHATPSRQDSQMTWGEWPALIVSVREEERCELRAWRRCPLGWQELILVDEGVTESSAPSGSRD